MKRISKKVREDAATICAIAASSSFMTTHDVAVALGLCGHYGSCPASELSYAAWLYVWRNSSASGVSVRAEAESLLRSGWSPK